MGWWMVLGSVWFVLFWGLIVWAILSVFSGGAGTSSDKEAGAPAIEIARRRYAGGEISKEEFEQIRKDLGS
jgi:putative membrane protein